MTGYELRIWPIPFGDLPEPLETITFNADSEADAVARMNQTARTLRRDRQVFLHRAGGGRSIASEDGLAEVPCTPGEIR